MNTKKQAIREFITHRMEDDPDKCVIVLVGERADIYAPTWADVVGVEVWEGQKGWLVDFVGEGLVQFEPSAEQLARIQAQSGGTQDE